MKRTRRALIAVIVVIIIHSNRKITYDAVWHGGRYFRSIDLPHYLFVVCQQLSESKAIWMWGARVWGRGREKTNVTCTTSRIHNIKWRLTNLIYIQIRRLVRIKIVGAFCELLKTIFAISFAFCRTSISAYIVYVLCLFGSSCYLGFFSFSARFSFLVRFVFPFLVGLCMLHPSTTVGIVATNDAQDDEKKKLIPKYFAFFVCGKTATLQRITSVSVGFTKYGRSYLICKFPFIRH